MHHAVPSSIRPAIEAAASVSVHSRQVRCIVVAAENGEGAIVVLSPDGPDGRIATKTRGESVDPLNTCPVHLFAPAVATWQNALPGHAAGAPLPSLSGRAPLRTRGPGGAQPTQRAPLWCGRLPPDSVASRVNRPIAPLAEPEPGSADDQITPTWPGRGLPGGAWMPPNPMQRTNRATRSHAPLIRVHTAFPSYI